MGQREELRRLIINFCQVRKSREFSLTDLHNEYQNYENINIGGQTPQATVRRLLQELRDEGTLLFMNQLGRYVLRNNEDTEMDLEDIKNENIVKEDREKIEYHAEVYKRNIKCVTLAKEKFGDYCLMESCHNSFVKPDGSPYIEVHHIIPLCEGGGDEISNLSVLCAHHHKMAHFAREDKRAEVRRYLLNFVGRCAR